MNNFLSLKTLLRSPVKTILTFLLIAAASFALFSRVTDYAVTAREMARAESFFTGVAALDNRAPDTALTAQVGSTGAVYYSEITTGEGRPWPNDEQIEAFSSLHGVTLADTRYMTAGLVEGYKRMVDQDVFVHMGRFAIEAAYVGYDVDGDAMYLAFDDVKVLAGDIRFDPEELFIISASAIEDFIFVTNPYPPAFFEKLDEGSRCLVLGAFSERTGSSFELLFAVEAFTILDGLPDNYLETEEFIYRQRFIESANQATYTYDIVYTSDMRSIPRMGERNMVIAEGRPLMAGDTGVCVVSTLFIETHGLAIGDKINIELGDKLFRQNGVEGARYVFSGGVSNFVTTAELEIVGAYSFTDTAQMRTSEWEWSYTQNTIFVPASLLSAEVPAGHEPSVGEFSVFIENARDIEAFLDEAKPLIAEMGVAMRFSDGGWLSIQDSFETGTLFAFLTTVLYIAGALLALLLAAYLYIGRNKKTYAIMRALGVSGKSAQNSLALPFGVLSALAIPAGGMAGLHYTSNAAAEVLEGMITGMPDGYVINTSLPPGVVLLCLLCKLVFITFTAWLFLRKMRKTPPLELLQSDMIRVGNDRQQPPHPSSPDPCSLIPDPSHSAECVQRRRYSALRHVTAYIFRRMRRGVGKTAISLILAVVLTSGVGLLVLTRLAYQDAFHAIDVRGRALGFSNISIDLLSKSDLTNDFYYHGNFGVLINGLDLGNIITFTNDIDRYLKDVHASEHTVEYAAGFDASIVEGSDALCLLGSGVAEMHGVGPGDRIALLSSTQYFALAGVFEDEEDDLAAAVAQESIIYRVAGVIDSDDAAIAFGIFAPVSRSAERVFGQPFPLEYSEFILADNERADELSSLLSSQIETGRRFAPMASFYIDTTGLDNIKLVRELLVMLFPIAVTAAILIGLTAPGLAILQSAKEAALLRVLGVTKRRTRCMLMFEQICLCIVGISLAAGGLALYNSGLFTRSAETLAVCGALYLSGCFCVALIASVQVTRRRVLELLQIKE